MDAESVESATEDQPVDDLDRPQQSDSAAGELDPLSGADHGTVDPLGEDGIAHVGSTR